MKTISFTLLMASLLLTPISQGAPAPLSCDMQTMLVGATALSRDAGIPKEKTVASLNTDGELTKAEVKFIIDKVYVQGVGKSPNEIKDAVYKQCKRRR